MSVVLNAVETTAHLSALDPQTITNVSSAGSNRLGTIDIRLTAAAYVGGNPTGGVIWGGVPMIEIGSGAANGTAGGVRSYKTNGEPPTAASSIVIDFDTALTLGYCIRTWNGVNQTTPTSGVQAATGNDTTPTVDTTASTVDGQVVSIMTANVGSISGDGAGQTADGADFSDGGNYTARCTKKNGTGSAVTMSHTIGSAVWAMQAYSINPASVGGDDLNALIGEPISGSSVLN